jgi:glycerol-3-phosphate dehydrogenase subunit B
MRIHQILVNAVQKLGGQVFQGMEAVSQRHIALDTNRESGASNPIEAIYTEAAARPTAHAANNFILATGGILGGGILTEHNGLVIDPIFDLPIHAHPEKTDWVRREFLHPEGHPIMAAGIPVNEDFRTEINNLYAIGGALAGDFVRQRALEGVAIVSANQVGEVLA